MKTIENLKDRNLTVSEFLHGINLMRIKNKNSWYGGFYTVENKTVKVKGYNTYLQIFEIENIRFGGLMDITVKQFKLELSKAFEYFEPKNLADLLPNK